MCVNPKYNINRRLKELPGRISHNKYRLSIAADISDRTLDNWIDTEKSEKFSIPSDALFKIASFFNCNASELING